MHGRRASCALKASGVLSSWLHCFGEPNYLRRPGYSVLKACDPGSPSGTSSAWRCIGNCIHYSVFGRCRLRGPVGAWHMSPWPHDRQVPLGCVSSVDARHSSSASCLYGENKCAVGFHGRPVVSQVSSSTVLLVIYPPASREQLLRFDANSTHDPPV